MEKGILLPVFYLAPIAYYRHILQTDGQIWLETQENFPKQTYRNRASIHAANGALDLIIPVKKSQSHIRSSLKEVQIMNDSNWQRLHWKSLGSAYRRSAYFEFYEEDFAYFYETKHTFLLDFNLALHDLLLSLLKIDKPYSLTFEYQKHSENLQDLRGDIHPKKEDPANKPYFQVFEPKNGFLPNLSVVDLLFSQGPNSKSFLL